MERLREVEPGELHLAPGRQDGADPVRYNRQVARFGNGKLGMPRVEVTEGRGGEYMINNGVTRATRIHYLAPGQTIPVEVIEIRPKADFSRLKRVREVPSPE